ncbi:MAG: aminomethyl-transferring glycine dehydrogenase [Calditrichia bacterium]
MKIELDFNDKFVNRHIGPNQEETKEMLKVIGVDSLDQLIDETIPADIRMSGALSLPDAISEYDFLEEIKKIAGENEMYKSFIGLGYYDCIVPPVILRNILENPGWYTQYTPYQAEIAQGRLEALINFQTMVSDLTALEIANSSLLDEATAAAEAMTMCYRLRSRELVNREAKTFFVSDKCFPQTIALLKTRSEPLGLELRIGHWSDWDEDQKIFGAIVQYPDADGKVEDVSSFIEKVHRSGALSVVAADLLSLALLTPPGELGADIVVGSSQRFGVPMGYGGPHAAFFATRDEFKRQMPGRIIGLSQDSHGKPAYRMALQTREQHIRREKATSNIGTAQALLAIMAGMYAVYHGPRGIKAIAERVHGLATLLESKLSALGFEQENSYYFDTLKIKTTPDRQKKIRNAALEAKMNFRYMDEEHIGISLDETTRLQEIQQILSVFAAAADLPESSFNMPKSIELSAYKFPIKMRRTSKYLQHPVFNSFHSETEMMRYIKKLENRDLSLTFSMIPLGSCTMKLNATVEMIPVSWKEFAGLHPFAPTGQAAGYHKIFNELGEMLCKVTGFDAISFQPNSGAQGEYSSLMVIRAYHRDRGEGQRNVVLIPSSAHGTNPASATMAGLKVVVVKCDELGNIDLPDLKEKASEYKDTLAAIMVTYPSTHGVFEENIKEICAVVHQNGGMVFMDGANMNAQVGLTSPAIIGADICHLNLHKTFSIPHGGGGPGMGPICTAKHLTPYLPGHPLVNVGGEKGISAVAAAPWGSADILVISYAYLKLLGAEGATMASKYAILNANYIKSRLETDFKVLYRGAHGRVAHELIFDFRQFKMEAGIDIEDVAKRLIDYGFHAPTVAWPVLGTMMVEPTESESKAELDRFCNALLAIKKEILEIAEGEADREDNVLKNSPHTVVDAVADQWQHAYPRSKAFFPLPYLKENKFWPAVGRIDNVYGDRHLMCTCPPLAAYDAENL